MTLGEAAALFCAGMGGGALNAVAGGGSLLTFPALLLHGVPPVVANASSAVALWPGSIASARGYRGELGPARPYLAGFGAVSLAGGLVGALLLLHTPASAFRALVPWLMLLATLVFAFGGRAVAALGGRGTARGPTAASTAAMLAISVYGGYFGGGMGIMMLAVFAAMGMDRIHTMNGLKSWCAVWINAVAVVTFTVAGVVWWPHTAVMLAGAVAGGMAGAAGARRVDPALVRRFVIALGLALSAYFFVRG
jgi:hypothetical protein